VNYDIKGNGIGLYFTKKVIEKHKGTIQLIVKEDASEFIILI
jgi:two-component system phosphate regulon sensor histidine kinase PhoR